MSRSAFFYYAALVAGLSAFSPALTRAQSSPAAAVTSGPQAGAPGEASDAPLDFTGDEAAAQKAPPPVSEPAPAAVAPPPAPVIPPPAPLLAAEPERPVRMNAINLSVLGFVIGNVRLTYERLLLPMHGVLAEAIVAPDVLRGFDFIGVGGALGYRFHWRGAGTSGFVGATVSVVRHSGTTATIKLGEKDTFDFRGSAWTIGIAPHVGKRWIFERSGVNLTLRVGGGFGYNVVNPDADSERKANRNLRHTYLITDGELSVGYSF